MITTNEGVTIKFTRLDEWVIKMEIWVDGSIKGLPLCTVLLTIQDFVSEINLLQRSKPKKP